MNSSRKSRKRLWIIPGSVAAVLIASVIFVARALSMPDKLDVSQLGKAEVGDIARSVVAKIAPLGVEKDNVTTFEVQISIDNPGGELKANMTANAEVVLEEQKHVLTVPEQAVLYDKDRKVSVWVPYPHGKDGHRVVSVKTGLSNGSRVEISSGLKAGDTVILQQTS